MATSSNCVQTLWDWFTTPTDQLDDIKESEEMKQIEDSVERLRDFNESGVLNPPDQSSLPAPSNDSDQLCE